MTTPSEWTSGYVDLESDPRIVKRMAQVRDITVSDLISWCVDRDLSPLDATITSTHVKWESPETAEERERRIAWEAEREASTLKWEHETYERLNKKFGL